jgi:hypothetical protein
MSYTEYQGWQAYFMARPVGWRDDNRVMPLLQAQGIKVKPAQIFPSLAAIAKSMEEAEAKEIAEVPEGLGTARNLKNSVFFTHMLGAEGGFVIPGMEK